MNIKTTKFISPENEKLTVIFILDDDGSEIERYSFYNEPIKLEIEPELERSIEKLPELLYKIYRSGLNGENINFTSDEMLVN